jgi:hypothetical protein
MDDTQAVGVLQRLEHREDELGHEKGIQRALLLQQVGEGAPLHVRHHIEDETVALTHEMDGDGSRVVEASNGAGLLLEARAHPMGPGHVGTKDLHRQPAVEFDIADFEDVGEAALGQPPHDHVLGAERLAQHGDELRISFRRDGAKADALPPRATAARARDVGHR